MSKRIILTSNGFNNKGERSKEIEKLLKKVSKDKKIILIGNAAKNTNISSREEVRENFKKAGAKEVFLIDIDSKNVNKILNYDIMYVLGGDIGELIELNNETEFKQYVTKFIENGIYIGESAGSIIMGNDCKWIYEIKKGTKPKYDKTFKSYLGLGLTNLHIYPHYNEANEEIKERIRRYEEEYGIECTKLNDGEFIEI